MKDKQISTLGKRENPRKPDSSETPIRYEGGGEEIRPSEIEATRKMFPFELEVFLPHK